MLDEDEKCLPVEERYFTDLPFALFALFLCRRSCFLRRSLAHTLITFFGVVMVVLICFEGYC